MKEIIEKAMSQLDSLIDDNSEFRWTNRAKSIKILVNKNATDFGKLVIYVKHGYIEVYKRLGTYPKVSCRSFGRILLNLENPELVIDHINGNPLDCRLCNMRVCNRGANSKNKKKFGLKSNYKGINIDLHKVRITVECQNDFIRHRLPFNQDVLEKLGAIMYDILAIKLHNDYSRLNFDKSKYSDEMVEFIYELIKDNISHKDRSHQYL